MFTVGSVGITDVHYGDRRHARAALLVCQDIFFARVTSEHVIDIDGVAEYESGALYKRELPCIRAVLAMAPHLQLLIVDGYATLDPQGRPGLGAHVAEATGTPVIGIAKTPFRGATHAVEVRRGTATRPLYVTAAGGLTDAEAAKIVAEMTGPHRLPTAMTRVDKIARGRAIQVRDESAITRHGT
jgi:deoxyribonuclease V